MFAWGHTTYAYWHGMIFNFEDKWDLDYFLAHADGAKRVTCEDAYKLVFCRRHIQIISSRCLGTNKYRGRNIKEWKKIHIQAYG